MEGHVQRGPCTGAWGRSVNESLGSLQFRCREGGRSWTSRCQPGCTSFHSPDFPVPLSFYFSMMFRCLLEGDLSCCTTMPAQRHPHVFCGGKGDERIRGVLREQYLWESQADIWRAALWKLQLSTPGLVSHGGVLALNTYILKIATFKGFKKWMMSIVCKSTKTAGWWFPGARGKGRKGEQCFNGHRFSFETMTSTELVVAKLC